MKANNRSFFKLRLLSIWQILFCAGLVGGGEVQSALALTTDSKAPVVGDGISISTQNSNGFQLVWGAANDDITPVSKLRYRLITAARKESIDTLAEAKSITGNGILMDWTQNALSFSVSNLAVPGTYYYSVIVADSSGKMALYAPVGKNLYVKGSVPLDAINGDDTVDEEGFHHHFVQGKNDLSFHLVDKGDSANPEKIVFFHGVPDSWYLWHYQMNALASKYHVIALDLKGAGQSSKPKSIGYGGSAPGSVYNPEANADEMLTALDNYIGHSAQFHVVSEDWGTVYGEAVVYLAGPSRVRSFIRGQAPVNTGNATDSSPYNPVSLLDCPEALSNYIEADIMQKNAYVDGIYNTRTHDIASIDTNTLNKIKEEFSFQGTYDGWVAYQYGGVPNLQTAKSWFGTYNFPVLQLEGDSDVAQPPAYFVGNNGAFTQASYFPKQPVYLEWIKNAGHFWPHEAPEASTHTIETFIEAAINGTTYIPTNSQCARSNNFLYDPGEQFCLNSTTLGTCQGSGQFTYTSVPSCNVSDQGSPNGSINPVSTNTTCSLEAFLCPELIGTTSNCPVP